MPRKPSLKTQTILTHALAVLSEAFPYSKITLEEFPANSAEV